MNFQSLPKGFPENEFRKILGHVDLVTDDVSDITNALNIAHGKVEGETTDILSFDDEGDIIKVIYFKSGGNYRHTFSVSDLRDLKRLL